MKQSTILIADDHPIILSLYRKIITAKWPDSLQVIEAVNGREALEKFRTYSPDLIPIDQSMPYLKGYEVAEQILKRDKGTKIILATLYDSLPIIMNFFRIGGRGFLSKNCCEEDIERAISTVLDGHIYFHSQHEGDLRMIIDLGLKRNMPKVKLTDLELTIVSKVAKGMANTEIAEALGLSVRTIEAYRFQLVKKTHVKNSLELIDFIYRNGIAFEN